MKQRKTAPKKGNKYYTRPSHGGLNKCINISDGFVLANCVGYCWGRAYEVLGYEPALPRTDARTWYGYSNNYEHSKRPRKGSIACWDGKHGHVAFVEDVLKDGTIVTSESNYGGTLWYSKNRKPPYNVSGLSFQGFIYLPINVEEQENEMSEQEAVNILANKVIRGELGNGQDRKERLYKLIQDEVNRILG